MIKLRMHPEEFRAIIWRLERIMAEQTNQGQQLTDLMGLLSDIQSDVNGEVSRMQLLETTLVNLQNSTPAEVNLQPAIDLATSIKQNLESAANPAPAPAGTTTSPTPVDPPVATEPTPTDPPADPPVEQPVA